MKIKKLHTFNLIDFIGKNAKETYQLQDAWIHGLLLLIITLGFLTKAVNLFGAHYDVSQFGVSGNKIASIPLILMLLSLGYALLNKYQRAGLLMIAFSQAWLYLLMETFGAASLLVTPYPLIDHSLLKIDQWLGFQSLNLMNAIAQFPHFKDLLFACYNSWMPQILITPLLLALLKERTEMNRYLFAMALSFFIAGTIYYFFPTIAPAGILHSPHFLQCQNDLVTRFHEIHHYQKVTVFNSGLIAFPSCHVMGALFVTYAFRKYKFLFFPLIVLNTLLIFATLALGFHYLVDVLAGFLIFFGILIAMHKKAQVRI